MKIGAATKVLGVVGDPVAHSLSPVMHNGWIEDHGLDAVYVALRLQSADAEREISALKHLGFAGLNVTLPHKQAAARAADRSEDSVANTLRWERDGTLSAFSTDGAGFLDALSEATPDWRMRVRNALIVGAGGAALGIGKALSPYVEAVRFTNRTPARAEAAAALLANGSALRWEDMQQAFASTDLIVQATSLGLDSSSAPDWPVAHCQASAIVADIVYRPLETQLLCAANRRGLATMDGLGMLIHQGARAFELWFGIKPDPSRARQRLLAALAP